MTNSFADGFQAGRFRQQAATATRDAILGAAQDLFATQGYPRTTVAQIAAAAQVAANTVYARGPRRALAARTGPGD